MSENGMGISRRVFVAGAGATALRNRTAEKLLEQLKDEENRGAAAFLEALDRPQAPEGMCSRR